MGQQHKESEALSYEDWRAKVAKDFPGGDVDKTLTYPELDSLGLGVLEDEQTVPTGQDPSGFPGLAPFTRGTHLPGNQRLWTVGQIVETSHAERAHRFLHHDLKLGVAALWLRLDVDAGRLHESQGGIPIHDSAAFAALLQGVDPSLIELTLDVGPRPILAAGLLAQWSQSIGTPQEKLSGGFAVDPLGDLARSGRSRGSIDAIFEDLASVARWCLDEAPGVRSTLLSSVTYHEAGATPAQELALSLSAGVETLRRLAACGLGPNDAAAQILVAHAVGHDVFLEIAKLRAWRLLWAKALQALGAGSAASQHKLAILPASRSLTRVDPWVNLLRASAQTFVGACTQADLIFTPRFDQLLGEGDEQGRRTAINTQHVLAQEAHLGAVADPAGGSWALEKMTDRLARAAWGKFQHLEAQGGFLAALGRGEIARELAPKVEQRRRSLATRRQSLVGVSVFPRLDEPRLMGESRATAVATSADEARGLESRGSEVRDLKVADIPKNVAESVASLSSGISLGTLASELERGEPSHCEPLSSFREAEDFERVRLAVDALADQGTRPCVLLAGLGTARESRARVEFSAGLFSVAGLETVVTEGLAEQGWDGESENSLVAAFKKSGARAAVLCSSDDRYGDLVPPSAAALKGAGARRIFVAGKPGEHEAEWRKSGVNAFVFLGCDLLATFAPVLEDLGLDTEKDLD